ncbi:hypothetical protein MRX96_040794 [Rhipicephalus microplus]
MVSKHGVMTQVIQGFLPPFSSSTAPTTTSGVAAQRYYVFSRTDALPSTMPGINPGTFQAVTKALTAKREPLISVDSSFIKTPAMA